MKTKQLFLTLLALLTSIGANAYSFKVNGIYYRITSTYSSVSPYNKVSVTYQSYVSLENGGTVPSGYVSHKKDRWIGWDDEGDPIYGTPYDAYYTSDMSGTIVIPSTVTNSGTTYQVTGIDDYAFENCSVTSITIQHSLNDIAEAAFSNYKGSLTINSPLQVYQHVDYDDDGDPYYWNYYPFSNCKFTSLTLGSNVTSIPDRTFEGNTAMTSLNLPSTLANIGQYAFSLCSGITTLTLPSSLTSIGYSAFSGCSKLAVIDINTTNLTSIASNAFYNCSKLNTVNLSSIPNWLNCSLTNSASSPFCNGADLYVADEERTTLSFPVATAKIPAYAFYGCRNITSVTIPAQVNTIGTQAFGNCPSLTAINVNSNNSNFSSEDGILYNANKTTLFSCLTTKSGAITIPQTVNSIGGSAFQGCTGITSLTLPSSLTSVGTNAFYGCSGITTVNVKISDYSNISNNRIAYSFLPTSATWNYYINDNLVTTLVIPSSVTSIGNNAFYNAKGITSLTLPNTLTSIGNSAFYNCSGITSLTLPNTLTSIGNSAFYNCSGITSLTLPNSMTSIGNSAFYGCKGALTVNCNIPNASSYSSSPFYNSSFSSVTFGNNVTSIGNYAFYGSSSITSLTLPNTLTSIGNSAFYNCSGITSLTLPNSMTSIGNSAFYGCKGALTVNCNIPNASSYSSSPFYNSSFSSVTFGNNVTSIGNYAFYGRSSITSLTLPHTLTSIGNSAFYNCSGITTVTIPNTLVTSVGTNAFSGCSNIATVNTKISDISSISSDRTIFSFLPVSATWNYYLNDNLITALEIPSSVTSIGDNAFYNAKGITSLTLPNTLTSIGNSAFYNCSGITTVTIPNTLVTSVGTNAFSGCSNIATVNTKISDISSISSNRTICSFLPVSATWNYYLNDNLITALDVPSSVTSIGNNAFYYAKGITSITLPNTLTRIGNSAFYGCTPTAFICKATTPPSLGSSNNFGGQKKIYVPYKSMNAYKSAWSQLSTPIYTYLPLLDVMFFEQQTAASYANELTNKDKSKITSVAFYEGGLDNSLTASVLKDGMNPNCLYYVPSSAGLSGDNIVILDDYEAESVTLTDNYTYDCPIPFHAEEIKYVHDPSVWANGSAGWETICLPFAPESFEASERGYISPIMLGTTGNFWLRKFMGASSDAVYFSSTIDGQMEANTPYLVAFPGSSMGTGHLQGQTITFTGSDAYIQVTEQPEVKYNDFIFVGNYDTTADGISGWALDASGSTLTTSNTVGNQPFRAYFKNTAGQASNVKLRIDFSDPTDVRSLRAPSDFKVKVIGDGQLMVQSNNNRTLPIYSVDGRLAKQVNLTAGENHISGLHKGLYIIDNQKIIVR